MADLKSELQRLEGGGSAATTAALLRAPGVPSGVDSTEDISMRPQTVDLILQRVQVRHSVPSIWKYVNDLIPVCLATATAKTSVKLSRFGAAHCHTCLRAVALAVFNHFQTYVRRCLNKCLNILKRAHTQAHTHTRTRTHTHTHANICGLSRHATACSVTSFVLLQ